MKQSLTAAFVDAVKPPEQGSIDYFDVKCRGLALRVQSSGVKTFWFSYRFDKRARRMTIERYPDCALAEARTRADAARHSVALGTDPGVKVTARREPTFGEIAALYLAEARTRKRTADEDARALVHDVLPYWRDRKVSEITRLDCKEIVERVRERGAGPMSNRIIALISAVLNFAVDNDVIQFSPAVRLKKAEEKPRDRVLTFEEIRTLWTMLDKEPLKERSLFRLGLLTAARLGELNNLTWSEVDFVAAMWTLPASRSKNKIEHRVPLVGTALAILRELRESCPPDEPLVFRGQLRRRAPMNTMGTTLARLRAGGLDFRFHDLRRTMASLCASIGIPELTVSWLLNHSAKGVTSRVYLHYSHDNEKRAALERWDRALCKIVGLSVDSVVVQLHA
jgi:integrase